MNKQMFFNTMTRETEEFRPIRDGEVTIYICGPTVYNFAHIGNLKTFLFEDLMRRWLKYRGYKVRQAMNLTDVDDKTIRGSQKQKMSLDDYTAIYKKAFFEDLETLKIDRVEYYPAATEHIKEMIDLVSDLIAKGFAYETDDGVYYRVSAYSDYGKLARLDRDQLLEGASGRVASDEYNRESISDFALWKKWTSDDGDVKWDAPFGAGRPGWHLECSAMSMKYLGETIDIHAGGVDLIFPHHENEIAQSEAATGKKFVNYWLHSTHLMVNGEKMSKSLGNFFTLRDLLEKGFTPRAIRYALITGHYRKPLNFTFEGVKAAEGALARIDDFIISLKNVRRTQSSFDSAGAVAKARDKFENALSEDLNIAEAMGAVFELIKEFNENMDRIGEKDASTALEFFRKIDAVLQFLQTDKEDALSAQEQALIDARSEAKKAKDFKKADEIREQLKQIGLEVRDTPQGVVWKRI